MARIAFTTLLLGIGAAGGALAYWLSVPMPFMVGALVANALFATIAPGRFPVDYLFPGRLRISFLALVGVAIGGQITPDLLARLPEFIPSLTGVLIFVPLAHVTSYQILRRVGGFARAEAYYAGAPGGLIESTAMAEEAGADIRVVALQHFIRIVLVVVAVPAGLSLYLGEVIGVDRTGGGFDLGLSPVLVLMVSLAAAAGYGLGRLLRLPAKHLTGPLFLTAILSGLTGIDMAMPTWVIWIAQCVVGSALGARFFGMSGRIVRQAMVMNLLTVSAMIGIGMAIASVVTLFDGQSPEMLILTFAPGGLTEMGLMALALSGNSAIVVLHHILRIAFTIFTMAIFLRLTGFTARS